MAIFQPSFYDQSINSQKYDKLPQGQKEKVLIDKVSATF